MAKQNKSRGAKRRMAELKPRRDYQGDLKAKNLWIVGPTGSGKSRMVHDAFDPSRIYHKSLDKWWDAYRGEKCVLIEDADPVHCKHLARDLKLWSDRYSLLVEKRHGHLRITPADYNLIVTSKFSLEQCFQGTNYESISDRFDVLVLK